MAMLCFKFVFGFKIFNPDQFLFPVVQESDRVFKKLPWQQQQEHHKTIGFNEKKKALHVCYKFWYISSLYPAKQINT